MPEPTPNKTRAGEVYEVFAAFRETDPLHHVGTVIAPDAGLARTYAFTLYQEVTWSRMIAVPRSEVVTVIEAQ